jgi:transcriptional regulator with XRE-family HTH domain
MSGFTYNRVKELLAKKGKRNKDLSNYIDNDERTVSQWCTNSSQPTIETLFKIADFLDVEAGELLNVKSDLKPVIPRASVSRGAGSKPVSKAVAFKGAARKGKK